MVGFADSIKINSNKILQQVDKKCYSIAWNLFTDIVHRTPVDKGLLINNWFPAVNSFSSETTTATSTSGSDSLSRITALANSKAFLWKDGKLTLSNNISYAYRAEMRGWPKFENGKVTPWTGRVGPYRMVALALQAATTPRNTP